MTMLKKLSCLAALLFCVTFSARAATLNAYMTTASGAPNCLGNNISFKDSIIYTGSGSITSISWDFGDGNTTTSASQGTTKTHAYANPGSYTAKLTVTTSDGLSSSVTRTVTVYGPSVGINYPNPICEHSDKVYFNDNTTFQPGDSGASYSWSFSDGSSSNTKDVSVKVFNTSGNLTVTHTVTSAKGCTVSKTFSITVKPAPLASAKAVGHCSDSSIVYDATATNEENITGLTYTWTFPDGSTATGKTVSKKYSAPGTYKATLLIKNPNGCDVPASATGTAYDYPNLKIVAKPTCQDSLMYFIDSSTSKYNAIVKFYINFDINSSNDTATVWKNTMTSDTIIGHAYSKSGTYTAKITAFTEHYCDVSERIDVTAEPTPKPDFKFSVGCPDSVVQFTDNSGTVIPTVSRIWFFGDSTGKVPNTSTQTNPKHAYAKAGTYKVKLIAFTKYGCDDSVTKSVKVFARASSDFSYTAKCRNSSMNFYDASRIDSTNTAPDQITRWLWDFGDSSNVDTNQNPVHTYKYSRPYNVRLVTFSKHGCTDTVYKQVSALPDPGTDFTFPTNNCQKDSIQFTNTTTGDIDSAGWTWDFGDGFNAYTTHPKHAFSSSGDIQVSLTATTKSGCSKTLTKTIHIIPSPQASFNYTPACLGEKMTFTNASTYTGGGNVTYTWSFGDGSPDTTTHDLKSTVSHLYNSLTSYSVTLSARSDSSGCSSIYSQQIPITPVPTAAFTKNDTCTYEAVYFYDKSTIAGGKFSGSYVWDFGDSTSSTAPNPTHKYKYPGKHAVKLTIFSPQRCSDVAIDTVITFRPPTPYFTYVSHCEKYQPLEFFDGSQVYNGTTLGTRLWDFGDNVTSTDVNPTHIFTSSSVVNTVKLTVTDDKGCSSTFTENVVVYPKAVPSFQKNISCPNTASHFFGNHTPSNVPVVGWKWFFGDGDSADVQTPAHVYTQGGKYTVTLITETDKGCKDTFKEDEIVPEIPVAKFGYTGANVGDQFQFFDSSSIKTGFISRRSWAFGEGSAFSSAINPIYTYTDTGVYTVSLVVYNQDDCPSDTFKMLVTVYPLPKPRFYTTTVCQGQPTIFSDSSTIDKGYIANHTWNFGDDSKTVESTDNTISHVYAESGTYSPTMKVTSGTGGSSTTTAKAVVLVKPKASFQANPGVVEIQNPVVQFANKSKEYSTLYWDFGDGTSDTVRNPKHTYTDTGTYIVKLGVTNINGCADTFVYFMQVRLGYTLFAPTVITVNGDGVNDEWLPKGTGVIDYQCIIVDRWGQTVFQTDDIHKPWKGDYNGNGVKVPEGVYVYYIKAGDFYNEDFKTTKGNITVIR